MVAKKSGHSFVWKHKENGKVVSTIQMNVKLAKTVDSGNGISSNLICDDCETKLSQKYICNDCGKDYTIRNITKRFDPDNEIVYEYAQKKAFMDKEVEQKIIVEDEISMDKVIMNIPFIVSYDEMYNNNDDASIATIVKIHSWLLKHNKVLVVSFGNRQKERAGLIIATKDRLLLAEIRDYRNIRSPKQEGLEPIEIKDTKVLEKVSKDTEPEMYAKFVNEVKKAKKAGKSLDIKTKEQKEETELIAQASFLDD